MVVLLFLLTSALMSLPGAESQTLQPAVTSNSVSALSRDTAVLLSDLTQGASNWIQSLLEPVLNTGTARSHSSQQRSPPTHSSKARRTLTHTSAAHSPCYVDYPQGFEPLRSECLAFVRPTSSPIIRNPFVSPVLASNNLLRGLPPVYIVVSQKHKGIL